MMKAPMASRLHWMERKEERTRRRRGWVREKSNDVNREVDRVLDDVSS